MTEAKRAKIRHVLQLMLQSKCLNRSTMTKVLKVSNHYVAGPSMMMILTLLITMHYTGANLKRGTERDGGT